MATSFDDLTLGEVEEITNVVLGGKPFSDPSVDPLMLAGGVMWVTNRKDFPQSWEHFKNNTKMSAIKDFATSLDAETESDPMNGHNVIVT